MEALGPELLDSLDTDTSYFLSPSNIFLNGFLHYLGYNYGQGVFKFTVILVTSIYKKL